MPFALSAGNRITHRRYKCPNYFGAISGKAGHGRGSSAPLGAFNRGPYGICFTGVRQAKTPERLGTPFSKSFHDKKLSRFNVSYCGWRSGGHNELLLSRRANRGKLFEKKPLELSIRRSFLVALRDSFNLQSAAFSQRQLARAQIVQIIRNGYPIRLALPVGSTAVAGVVSGRFCGLDINRPPTKPAQPMIRPYRGLTHHGILTSGPARPLSQGGPSWPGSPSPPPACSKSCGPFS